MFRKFTSFVVPAIVVASTAACTAETSHEAPASLPEVKVEAQGSSSSCTSAGVPISCTAPICSLPAAPELGMGPAIGYYTSAQCDAYARGCGKNTVYYDVFYSHWGGQPQVLCYFE